jgi:hypothetical protein
MEKKREKEAGFPQGVQPWGSVSPRLQAESPKLRLVWKLTKLVTLTGHLGLRTKLFCQNGSSLFN